MKTGAWIVIGTVSCLAVALAGVIYLMVGWAIESPRVKSWGEGSTDWIVINLVGVAYTIWALVVLACLLVGRR